MTGGMTHMILIHFTSSVLSISSKPGAIKYETGLAHTNVTTAKTTIMMERIEFSLDKKTNPAFSSFSAQILANLLITTTTSAPNTVVSIKSNNWLAE